jgi:hypothetical protein
MPVTVAARSEVSTLLVCSNAGIVDSRHGCVCVVLCVGGGLATG